MGVAKFIKLSGRSRVRGRVLLALPLEVFEDGLENFTVWDCGHR